MIYLADDYVNKYQNVLTYVLGRSIAYGYSFSFIERTIAYSKAFSEFEKSNVTKIAFSSNESIYSEMFDDANDGYIENPYDIYGWLGYVYINLFLKLKITFEMLFIALPIDTAIKMYPLYHEMDITHLENYLAEELFPSSLSLIMKKRNMTMEQLSEKASIPFATIRSLKLGYRDINKLEVYKTLLIAHALNVKIESLLNDIPLKTN